MFWGRNNKKDITKGENTKNFDYILSFMFLKNKGGKIVDSQKKEHLNTQV